MFLGAQGTHRRASNVTDDEIGADVGRPRGDVDLGAFVDGAAAHEHLTRLIEADAPAERRPFRACAKRLALGREHARAEVRAVAYHREETSHRVYLSEENIRTRASAAPVSHLERCDKKRKGMKRFIFDGTRRFSLDRSSRACTSADRFAPPRHGCSTSDASEDSRRASASSRTVRFFTRAATLFA